MDPDTRAAFRVIYLSLLLPFAFALVSLLTSQAANAQNSTKSAQIKSCVASDGQCPPWNAPSGWIEANVYPHTDDNGNEYQYHIYCPQPTDGEEFAGFEITNTMDDGRPYSAICKYGSFCPEPKIGAPPDCECPPGMMEPAPGFGKNSLECTDIVEDPTDCADSVVFDTGVSYQGNYMCGAMDDSCPSGFDLGTAYNPETGESVNTCDDGWTDDSSSSSSDSSSSSGNDSSDGGDDDNDGDGDSSDGDDANNSSSSGSSSSSGNPEGECDPKTETCENTASGGEDCGEPPQCEGDGIQCAQLLQQWYERCPNTGLEEFDGIEHELDMDQRVQEAIDEYEQRFNEIKGDFQDTIGAHLGGGQAGIPSNKHTVHGQEIEIGIASRKDFFDLIRNLIYFGCLLYAFYILMRA